jgi:hypothetical protein
MEKKYSIIHEWISLLVDYFWGKYIRVHAGSSRYLSQEFFKRSTERNWDLSLAEGKNWRLPGIVSRKGLQARDLEEMDRIHSLLWAKDYAGKKKGIQSKII